MRRAPFLWLSTTLSLALLGAPARAQVGTRDQLPIEMPERPFLLVDAPRRFLPSEVAEVRVQLRSGGELELSLFRVHDPSTVLGQAGRRQGVSVAATPIGAEAEALLGARGGLPRRGRALTLVRRERLPMPHPGEARRIHDETVVYDDNEDVEEDVATYWVQAGGWSVRRARLGRLAPGLYLVQARGAAWVSSALISVGELVVIARRGDRGDLVLVTDEDGVPQPGIEVLAIGEARAARAVVTGADGVAHFAASDAATLRFRASRGADVAWADVAHVRLPHCDPRVYLATGRPLYRSGEVQYVRGHVRGCPTGSGAVGAYAPLANHTVTLRSGDNEVHATTDADGNFVAQLVATFEIVAVLDGREHRRPVRIDTRTLPVRDLVVSLDRSWAAAGDVVRVTVADTEGGWPDEADVVLDTPSGQLVQRIGPHRPATFDVRVPTMDRTAGRLALHASLSVPGRVTMASAELVVGRSSELLELDAEETRGTSGALFAIEARGTDLGGGVLEGPVRFAVLSSDGNEARGAPRHEQTASLYGGRVAVRLPLVGEGPWMIRATRDRAEAQLVVWARERPPQLSRRGDLALLPRASRTRPGESLEVDVRLPPGGRGWLTLEQGDVTTYRSVRSVGRVTRVSLPIHEAARGLASLVLTHVHAGRVRVASASVEVETAQPVALTVETDRAIYGPAGTAHVTIEAKTTDARPRDAVVSLWLADAGYWGLGEDDYPMPGDYLALPGRPASAADSQTPIAYGAEEGRRLDSELIFDGQRVQGASHRHGWHFGGEVVRIDARGRLQIVAEAIARAAGMPGARVSCPDDRAQHVLRARGLPWDLVALRVAEAVEAEVGVDDDGRLSMDCGVSGLGSFGGSGMGLGGGGAGLGLSGLSLRREERLEGTLHFVGLRRLGPDGRLELDVPLPDHPGRWRVEVLAIADDGGGARAHRVVTTGQDLEAWIDLPRTLRPTDRADGVIHIESRSGAARAEVRLEVPPELRLEGAIPTEVALVEGRATIPFSVVAVNPRLATLTLDVRAGAAHDASLIRVNVMRSSTERALYSGAVLGPRATEVDVPLPELARPATLTVALDPNVAGEAERLLDELRAPRWDLGVMRADRLASLSALRRAMTGRGATSSFLADLDHAIASELHALHDLATSTGEIGWGDHADPGLTLEVLALVPTSMDPQWNDARAHLRDRLQRGELRGEDAARAARLLLEENATAVLTRALDESGDDPRALTEVLLAAHHHGERGLTRTSADRLVHAIDARLASPTPPNQCSGWAWFLCFSRRSERGVLARASLALSRVEDPRAGRVHSQVGEWLAQRPSEPSRFAWGSDEADLLELFAERAGGRDAVEIRIDGRRVSAPGGHFTVPAGAHRATLRFAERAGRLRRVAVSGPIDASAPSSTQGNAQLARRFDRRGGRWMGTVSFTLPRDARDLVLEVPLPAGLTVDHRQLAERGAAIVDGTLTMRWDTLGRGAHAVEIPMLALGSGGFDAGPAHLSAGEGALFGLTPAEHVDIAR